MVSVCYSPRFDSGYMFGVSLWVLLKEGRSRGRFSSRRGSHTEIWTLFPQAALMTSWTVPHFAAFFALRPHGRECPFFSPR